MLTRASASCRSGLPELITTAGATRARKSSPVLAAEYYVGGMIAAAKWWYTHNKPCTEEELIQHLCTLVEEKKIL